MSLFVLVHGSTHSAAAWDLVRADLERHGHIVRTPELPVDEPQAQAERYATIIARCVRRHDQPVVVAHSASGWFLPLVAAMRPVRRIVFLAAAVPRPGLSFLDLLQREPDMLNPAWIGKDPRVEAVADEFLLHDCPPERLRWAHETIRILHARAVLSEKYPLEAWPKVPVSYILCTEDRTIAPQWSRRIAQSVLGVEPYELPGGHCPYISRPSALAELLSTIAGQTPTG